MTDYYNEWSLLLLNEYFSPAVAGEEVWIQANREELDAFGFHLGGAGGLVDTVKGGPSWRCQGSQGMACKARDLARQRLSTAARSRDYQDPGQVIESYRGLNAPTYLPYVALWVLAASEPGPNGFYATVSDLVGLPFDGASARTRNAMEGLWRDLEYWSSVQVGGKLGIFHSRPLGGYPFVGLAKAQALVTGKDRDGINRLFKQAGLSPGQVLTQKIFRYLAGVAVTSNFLSAGLREALSQIDVYGGALEDIFRSRLTEWDGRLPAKRRRGSNDRNLGDSDEADREVDYELSLVLRPAFDVDWEIGWRLQATVEAARYTIEINNIHYLGYPDETTSYITCIDPENDIQQAARSVLVEAVGHDVIASLLYIRDGDDNGEGKRSCCLTSKSVRVLVWDTPNPIHGQELVERELPIGGVAYLLIAGEENLTYLDNEGIEYQAVEGTSGLPENWHLVCTPLVEGLSPEQKMAIQRLSGGTSDVRAKARIRFVGGCPILRGGAKQYAYYDLPMIELEAPIGAEISAECLVLEEVFSADGSEQQHVTSIRRFVIRREGVDKHQFELTASLGKEILSRAKLKVALSGGVATGVDKAFSIGRFGESIREDSGLRGAVLGEAIPGMSESLVGAGLTSRPWGTALSEQDGEKWFDDNIACKFLDMVAQKGSMEFGPARNLIHRLAQNAGILKLHPVFLMLELRSRGHIEIETDQKGHLLRVHAASPLIYSLPVRNESSVQWYGVCGSLRLEHWLHLYTQQEMPVRFEAHAKDRVPLLRLSVPDKAVLESFAQEADFDLATLPAIHVANWAGTLSETRERLRLNKGYENFRVKNQERLNPQSVLFKHDDAEYMKVDRSRGCELFRIDDPVIHGTQVYMLGSWVGDRVDFNYIQDSRWGIWLAVSAFARMISELGFPDAYPWPLHYSSQSGALWLPARMKPPLVIERALCFCSGSGPKQVQVDMEAEGETYLRLVDAQHGRRLIGKVSHVYTYMAKGTWLCYDWVPKALAVQIAAQLGCELKYI